jgi:hypothetical protein
MKQSIKHALHDHLQQKSLSEKQIKQLRQLQNQGEKNKTSQPIRWYIPTVIAISIILTVFLLYRPMLQLNQQNMAMLIAEEVVSNHLKLKPLEVKTNQFQDINHYFTMLDFVPIVSDRLPDLPNQLLGGRYCSLQGITAAQLRLRNANNGEIQTLYETGYNPSIFKKLPNLDNGEEPVILYVKGVKVDIWVEKGVLFALTHQPQNN